METFKEYFSNNLQGVGAGKTVQDLAKKHKVPTRKIKKQLIKGTKEEFEHTKKSKAPKTQTKKIAKKIATDHIWKVPNYYDKLKKYVESIDNKKVIAIVPGSFKPPHKGHLSMVEKYSKIPGMDQVIVLISTPSAKSQRLTVTGKPVTPEVAKQIFELYIKAEGLNNVIVLISDKPSPITAAYAYVESELDNAIVYLGSSKKLNEKGVPDYSRWKTAPKYFAEKKPSVQIIDPEKAAVDVLEGYSASDFRQVINNPEQLKRFLPDSIINKNLTKEVINFLT